MYWLPPNGLNQKPHELKATKLKFLFSAYAEQKCSVVASGLQCRSWRCVEAYAYLPYQCQDVVIDGHSSWKHSSSKLILLCWLHCTLMWHAASVHNNYDINTLTLTPEVHCSHTHVVRRTVTQISLPTKNPFTLLHLQKEVRCWVQKSDGIGAEIMKE